MIMLDKLRQAAYRLNCTLHDPHNWVGYTNDPAETDRLVVWLYLGDHEFYWMPPFTFRYSNWKG
jgi:hypothetical protein